ncbi:hypothetical protein GUJ93_ZPchr0003g16828 [Zizania palustris]|uniref:Uncharacterized protein n=1 Tax=Zizania palustris TaxID=103762 RepID=A0A8J5RVW8_ZIZPA|nr:hypothetical protein GUJ93_ZPchr0003g16828 [Zizania palustris]
MRHPRPVPSLCPRAAWSMHLSAMRVIRHGRTYQHVASMVANPGSLPNRAEQLCTPPGDLHCVTYTNNSGCTPWLLCSYLEPHFEGA